MTRLARQKLMVWGGFAAYVAAFAIVGGICLWTLSGCASADAQRAAERLETETRY